MPPELGDSRKISWRLDSRRKPPGDGAPTRLGRAATDDDREVWEQARAPPRAPAAAAAPRHTDADQARLSGALAARPCSPLRDRWWVGVEAPSNMALSRKSMVDSVYTIWNTCPSRAHSSSAATCRGDTAAPLGAFQAPASQVLHGHEA